jgi:hypothetical protein
MTLADGGVEVQIESKAEMLPALTEFTEQVFAVLKRPGVQVHPRAFLRVKRGRKVGTFCPASFPTPAWARAVIEQITMDISGMQPRFFYNEKPWLEQPAIYCSCYMVVSEAKRLVDDWLEERRKKREGHSGAPTHGRPFRSGG